MCIDKTKYIRKFASLYQGIHRKITNLALCIGIALFITIPAHQTGHKKYTGWDKWVGLPDIQIDDLNMIKQIYTYRYTDCCSQ